MFFLLWIKKTKNTWFFWKTTLKKRRKCGVNEREVTCKCGCLRSRAVAVAVAGDNGRPFIEAVGCRYNVWSQECAGTGPGIKYHLPWRSDKQQSVIINHEHYPNGIVPLPRPCKVKLWLLLQMKKNQTNREPSCRAAWKLVFISPGFITFRAVLRNCWSVLVWMPWKHKHTNASLRQ